MMIKLYCRRHLGLRDMPEECVRLTRFCLRRLDVCRWGDEKPTCANCPIHCYPQREREQIHRIMRWAGPRMMLYAPMKAIRHIIRSLRKPK